jgi:acyl-CoA reductase-like NAD-dependent aldehyde dehydrogenase
VRSHHHIERGAVRRSIALGKAGRTMKKSTRAEMGISASFTSLCRSTCGDRAIDRHQGGQDGRGAHLPTRLRKAPRSSPAASAAPSGTFFESTVLTDVTTDMVTTKEEILGPVAPLYRFKSDAEAIEMANAPQP